MRIIGGIYRSRRLLAPHDQRTTRPITDRVKQSLFDRLTSMGLFGGGDAGCRVLDVFSGSGSLGLEALSRGAEHCTFIEKDRSARQLLEKNLANLDLTGRAKVRAIDALVGGAAPDRRPWSWLDSLNDDGSSEDRRFGLVFCDPPYRMTRDPQQRSRIEVLIERLAAVTSAGGVLVARSDHRTELRALEGWHGPDRHQFGSMALHFYHRPAQSPSE